MKSLKLLLRFLTVGGLVLLLLIPLSMIRGTVYERKSYRAEATEQIARSTAGEQRLLAPLRVVPWTDTTEVEFIDSRGVARKRIDTTSGMFLQTPTTLVVNGEMVPDLRKLGLFEVRVYSWRGRIEAAFDPQLPQPGPKFTRQYGTPYLLLGVSDVRGLVGTPSLRVDGKVGKFVPGTRDYTDSISGVSATLPVIVNESLAGSKVEIEVVVAGTESLSIVPVADSNRIDMFSKWPHPQFSGDFLPVERKIYADDRGFSARWDVSSLASQAQAQLKRIKAADAQLESLKVSLVDPVDVYTQADRASKYGILFVVLTFVGFALFELIKRLPIHPLQYLLVGLALAIFFLLLLSLSEHIEFWKAYLISAAACIGLQFVYLSGVLKSWVRAGGFAVMLTALYGVLYSLLVSEDNALLMGSLLLFGILASIMWITRKVDWYDLGSSLR